MTTKQKDVFLDGEGDGWYNRNRAEGDALEHLRSHDPLLKGLKDWPLKNEQILEIGASNGWRLKLLKELFPEISAFGVEPSATAVAEADKSLSMHVGTADNLPFDNNQFDIVTFGFCLYLCDRADLFRIAAEADRVLKEGGVIITYDFHPDTPYKNAYSHKDDVYSYKADYSQLFTWNPAYTLEKQDVMLHDGCTEDTPDNRIAVSIIRKDIAKGWPNNPHNT